jgi:hypothetical protein
MPWKVTPSLYNSWLFYRYPQFDRDEAQEAEARAEFISALRKERKPDTPEQARGHLFENTIEYLATGKTSGQIISLDPDNEFTDKDELACARVIADNCRDGVFQERDGRELPSGNYIYGVADCILPTTIVDFKRVGAGKYEQGKYQESIQHLAYMYIWESKRFDYLICDGSDEPFDEFYTWNDGSLGCLESRIALMIHDINCDPEMAKIFAENWAYKTKGVKNV